MECTRLALQLPLLIGFADKGIVMWMGKQMSGKHMIRPMIHPEMFDGTALGIRMAEIEIPNGCEFPRILVVEFVARTDHIIEVTVNTG